jgi:SanA protein
MKNLSNLIALGIGAIAILIVGINLFVHAKTSAYIFDLITDTPNVPVVLIPGAAILRDGSISPVFRDRVDTAMDLYRAKKAQKILVSGDNSSVSHNEVDPVRLYLLNKGLPEKDIFLDHAGFDTYSTMYRARDIFGVTSVIVSSQSFHLPRAIFIARSLGIDAYGMSADKGHILVQNYIREVFADEKAAFDLLTGRKPKYLGDKISMDASDANQK